MTLTRWWLASLMALTLGVGGSWGQNCSRQTAPLPCSGATPACRTTPDTFRTARVPYYNEVADILFPPAPPVTQRPCSNPCAYQGLFDAVARNQAERTRDCATSNPAPTPA